MDISVQAAELALAVLDAKLPVDRLSWSSFGGIFEIIGSAGEMHIRSGRKEVINNPIGNHGDDSPVTKRYLLNRKWKAIAGSVLAAGGAATSAGTALASHDVIGAAQHLNAATSSAIHFVRITAIAKRYGGSAGIDSWLKIIAGMKTTKVALRGTQAASSLVPVINLGTGFAGAIVKSSLDVAKKTCLRKAQEIHYLADQEQRTNGDAGATAGPASAVAWEVMSRKSSLRVLGKYDVAAIIKEPAGWMPIGDKIYMV